jgi:murein L,D-transpeptidase YcbB/YkuD
MRKERLSRLLAGTMLALIVAAPAFAAPDRVESIVTPPPSLNGQTQRNILPLPPLDAEPRMQAPAAPRDSDNGPVFKGALDRLFAASDTQIIAKLRETITSKQFERRIEHAPERKAIETFYAARNYAPLWIRDGQLTSQAKALIARLKNASADGLDASDYAMPDFATISGGDALADGDIKLTNSALTYARHLSVGRIAPTRVSAEVDYGSHTPEPADVIKKIGDARDLDSALDSFNPPHDGFRALKRKLAELRANASEPETNRIPDGPAIKPGEKDTRVPTLRDRLGINGKPGDPTYDKVLFNAIKNVQARADIKPTGVIDSRTIAAINGPKPGQIRRCRKSSSTRHGTCRSRSFRTSCCRNTPATRTSSTAWGSR